MLEKTFPIYSCTLRWSQDGEHNPEYPEMHVGLPAGRVWKDYYFNKMFKEDQTAEQLQDCLQEVWENYLKKENPPTPWITKSEWKFVERETWMLTWFQHETFDMGQTDEEALESFAEYVDRKQDTNWKLGRDRDSGLMGAEDRWRWKGFEDGSDPPCRCVHCKAQGLLRIGH